MADLYNTEGYFSPTEHDALVRIEKEEKAVRKAEAFRPIVYICSPYAGDTVKNTVNARKYSRFALDRGCIPFAPHLLFPQFMNDSNPADRRLAMRMNMIMLGKCDELWVFGDKISSGMKQEIHKAERKCMKIRYFTKEMEEKA